MDSRSFARVVVIAPRTRVDLALPIDVPIVDLLPLLLEMVGERSDDGGSQHGGWRLSLLGADELPRDRTLRSLEIMDGSALHLTPREAEAAPPIYDDVVDAIAATIRDRISLRSTNPAMAAAAVLIGLVTAAVTLLYRGHDPANTYLAVGFSVLALGAASAIARGPGQRVVAAAVAAGGLPIIFVAGLDIVPGTIGRSGVMLGFVLTFAYSAMALAAIGTGAVVFTAAIIVSIFGAVSAAVSTVAQVSPSKVVAATAAVGVAAVAVLPWLVVRLARLPLPVLPTTAEQIRATSDEFDLESVSARARLADEYLLGGYAGCAVTIVFAAAVLSLHATTWSLALAGVCVVALALRTRGVAALAPRVAILGSCLVGIAGAGSIAVLGHRGNATLWLFGAQLGLAALAVFVCVIRPRLRLAPSTLRLVDFLETAVLVAIVPLAVGVMDLYSTMRHL